MASDRLQQPGLLFSFWEQPSFASPSPTFPTLLQHAAVFWCKNRNQNFVLVSGKFYQRGLVVKTTLLLALKYPGTVGQLTLESRDFGDIKC